MTLVIETQVQVRSTVVAPPRRSMAGRAAVLARLGSPPVQMVRLLAEQRPFLDFETAWRAAWDAILWPTDGVERRQWKEVLEWSKPRYLESYDGSLLPEHSQRASEFGPLPDSEAQGVALRWLLQVLQAEEPGSRSDLELVA